MLDADDSEMDTRSIPELSLWRRLILVVLFPFVMPGVVLVFVLLYLALAWNAGVYGICWLRWKLFAVPIPPISPEPPTERPAT
jgi:hypothetical protein